MYLDILEYTKGTLKIILYLDENKERNPEISRIIDDLGIPRQSCYTALQHMEESGLIVSSREKGRPPKVYCKLTQKGLEIAKYLRKVDNTLRTTIEGYSRQLIDLKRKGYPKKEYEIAALSLFKNLERECYNIGKWDDAINYNKEIIKICQRTQNHEGQAEAIRRIGSIHQKRQEYGKALDNFQRSLKLAQKVKDYKGMALDYYYRGNIFERKGEYSKALVLYKRCEIYADKSDSEVEKARAYMGRGRILAQQGSFEESVKVMKKALVIFERTGVKNEILKAYTSLGATEFYIDMDEAIKWHEKCIELSEKEGNKRMLGYSLANAAGCYIEKADFKKSKKYLDRALPIFEKLNEREMISSILNHYARIYIFKKQWSESKDYLDKAMKIARAIKIPSKIADVNLQYGLLHKGRGNDSRAKRYLRSALKIYRNLGEVDTVKEVEKELKELISQ